jgi:hypothetical protein
VRRRGVVKIGLAAVLVASVLVATNVAAVWRIPGGPLHWRFATAAVPGIGPFRIPAGFPTGQKLYWAVPQFASSDATIEQVGLSASLGVHLSRALVPGSWIDSSRSVDIEADSTSVIGLPIQGTLDDLPGAVHGYSCCEGNSELFLELIFDTPGEHELRSLSIYYSTGPLHYHAELALYDYGPEFWQIHPPPSPVAGPS